MRKDLDELDKVADAGAACTHGPWTYEGEWLGKEYVKFGDRVGADKAFFREEDMAKHIATFDPPTVKALIERVRKAETLLMDIHKFAHPEMKAVIEADLK